MMVMLLLMWKAETVALEHGFLIRLEVRRFRLFVDGGGSCLLGL
jgi:hypothetical protein